MEKLFRSLIPAFFAKHSADMAGFKPKRIDAKSMVEHSPRPLVLLTALAGGTEYFFVVGPYESSPGKVLVELGWRKGADIPYPAVTVDRMLAARKLQDPEFDWSVPSFAIRLATLCHQSRAERPWDMFSPQVWNRETESYDEFARRTAFSGIDEAIRVFAEGRFDLEYATKQVALNCGEILSCMREKGIAFLRSAASHRGEVLQ